MSMENSPVMETESHAPEGEFSHSPWVDLGTFTSPQHSPPMPEFNGFEYGPSPIMSVDGYGMNLPPPYTSMPLPMPAHAWPSMLTHHSPFHDGVPPPPAPISISPSAPTPIRKSSTGGATPRRTLTDDDRRQMCLYHEEHKTAKQTDIGALFGVERSTVSKVLRQKERYLNPDDGSRSPIKRAKGRVPDIEKALSNWVRNYQRGGYPINDEIIREKALFFASTTCGPEGKDKVLTTAWLEKFKQKNNLLGAASRKGSLDARRSGSNSPTRINTNFSSNGSAIHSPHNRIKREYDTVPELSGGYLHAHSKSTTSLDTNSTGMISPSSTLVSDSPFTPTSQSRLPYSGSSNNTNGNNSRPRSSTFPLPIDPTLITADHSIDRESSKIDPRKAGPVAILESPLEFDDEDAHAHIKGSDPRKLIKRNRSNPEITTKSMQPPPVVSKSATVSPISAPGSPTQDEARHALELVMNYFQHQPAGLAAQEYVTIGKLMERLDLAKSQGYAFPSGLPRIDEHDDGPRVSKKRSIHNLG
ncbi:DNA binding HTH domain Psq-type [Penicillium verhagenii]|nr:DNA binding HTH domain Psq-type [Penicillium verhagenii]